MKRARILVASFLMKLAILIGGLGLLAFAFPQTDCRAEQPEETTAKFWFASAHGVAKSKGQQLFEQDFSKYRGIRNNGDGLGPVFNAVSCVACHHQSTIGGGGGVSHNVDILTIDPRTTMPPAALQNVHPGFVNKDGTLNPSLIVHRHAADEQYPEFRKTMLGKRWIKIESEEASIQEMIERRPVRIVKPERNVYVKHTQRNTPAVFGSGLIDAVPIELMHQQAATKKRFGVGGRVSQLSKGKIGKFGWRAQLPTLEAFVLSACANELGLQVDGHKQPENPLKKPMLLTVPELSTSDTDAMVQYVRDIKPPIFNAEQLNTAAKRGLSHFNEIGCAECHVQHMGPAKDIFSDLLLHDMGSGLGDPVAATREIEVITRPNPFGKGTRKFFGEPKIVNMYYTGSMAVPQIVEEPNTDDPYTDVFERLAKTNRDPANEWRTPPLWGCADSAPYLHDGRAPTLHDAIIKHGGQSRRVRLNYMRLDKDEQQELLSFLNCLKAPTQPY